MSEPTVGELLRDWADSGRRDVPRHVLNTWARQAADELEQLRHALAVFKNCAIDDQEALNERVRGTNPPLRTSY